MVEEGWTTRAGRRGVAVLVALLAACLACTSAAPVGSAEHQAPVGPERQASVGPAERPNIVFVLADDLSWNLVQFMPHVMEMQRRGTTFTDYTVSNSLCCPSRATIFTGKYPHNTGVLSNMNGPDGGWELFNKSGDEQRTFATALHDVGYRTALMGKYMNGYSAALPAAQAANPHQAPGWDEWVIPTDAAINGFDYKLNENGTVTTYDSRPDSYATDVLAGKGSLFIEAAAAADVPFMLEVAPFAPHSPFVPAPRDADAFPGLQAPRGAAFDTPPANAPSWIAAQPPLSEKDKQRIDKSFRMRAQAVLALDALIGTLEESLEKAGVAENTFLVVSSDNGLHLGEHRLAAGKQSAFESDITVPLIVVGPGVPAGASRGQLVQNVDLAPTFQEIGGAAVADTVDGRSALPLLRGDDVPWRSVALVEHLGQPLDPKDPDVSANPSLIPPTYQAVRTPDSTYVMYDNGETEYYDLRNDPDQLNNVAGGLPPEERERLTATVTALATCGGGAGCWTAGQATGP